MLTHSCALQALLQDPGYAALSDTDKLHLLEYRPSEHAIGQMNLDFHWNVVYNSQLYFKYELLRGALHLAMGRLADGISSYSYEEIKD